MIEESKFKRAYKAEHLYSGKWGHFGLEIRVAIPREFVGEDNRIFDKVAEEIQESLMRATVAQDNEEIEAKRIECDRFKGCFPAGMVILMEEIPNGYCPRWCCSMKPWYKITTPRGVITIGWRKRVIHLEWESRVSPPADTMFPNEKVYGDVDVTRYGNVIHAYGYEKLGEYLHKLLTDPEHP